MLTLIGSLALAAVAFGLVFALGKALSSQAQRHPEGDRAPPDAPGRAKPSPEQPAPRASLSTSAPEAARDPEVLAALAAGQKILAIKRYRELTGVGLKEAKDAVDRLC